MSARETLADQFRHHFNHREHLYGVLLDHLADDLDEGGPTADICRDAMEVDREAAVQLRLLAGLFRIVLRGEAPELEQFYANLGGTARPDAAWPLVRPVLAAHVEELRAALSLPPQTNEVGRSAALLTGLFAAVRRHGVDRVRLLEPGASAGLNLNVDRYRFTGPGWSFGPTSPLTIDTEAALDPVELTIVDRRGCDLSPVDASTPEGARYLTSFTWPFNLERHARLAGALEVLAEHPVVVDAAPASAWVREQLAVSPPASVLTVVWQSITRQYWPAEESAAVDAAIEEARARMPISHVTMEGVPPVQGTDGYTIREHGPEVAVDGDVVARCHHHGPPIVLV